MTNPSPLDDPNIHVISNRDGASFDTFAYNLTTRDSLYYAFDPQQQFGRRALSSATDGARDYTVSLFEDGTATIGSGLRVVGEKISGVAVTLDIEGVVRVLINGELALEQTLAADPQLDLLVESDFVCRAGAKDLLSAFHRGNLLSVACVERGFSTMSGGTDGASYHVPPHIVREMDALILEAGAVPRPTLPLMVMPLQLNRIR